jgi:serine/threonine-protein kinase HipA
MILVKSLVLATNSSFQTMRLLRLPYPQAEQLFRRMVFNVDCEKCDDHTKTLLFDQKQGEWEPAYDICFGLSPR